MFLTVPGSCALFWSGSYDLNHSKVYGKGGRYTEWDVSPINYWLNVGIYLLVAMGGLCFSLFMRCAR